MKLPTPFSVSRHCQRRRAMGFTLSEVLIASAILLLVVTGILTAHLFGLKMFQVSQTKLSATEWSRRTFGKITDQVRASETIQILNVDTNGNFTGLLDGEVQQGNALQIFPMTNTDTYVIYFVDLADTNKTFRQITATPAVTNVFILADSVTNSTIFTAQDRSGNVLTNLVNNGVIHLVLEFNQPAAFEQDPYEYRLETAIKPRIVP
jgi:hypothetical protein